jgi:hypothetical protein
MARTSTTPTTKIICTILRRRWFCPTDPCPASHPIRMPQLAYETLWDTRQFNNKANWPMDGSQAFIWSTGDGDGYSR